MIRWCGLIFVFVFFSTTTLVAQKNNTALPSSNERVLQRYVLSDTLVCDGLSIIESTLRITDGNGNSVFQGAKVANTLILWQKNAVVPILPLTIRYRVFSIDLQRKISHQAERTLQQIQSSGSSEIPIEYDYRPEAARNATAALLDAKGLDYAGGYTRGVSLGNAQNLVSNANFNLQLAGKIGDDLEILAAMSDQSVPLQAEGNTRDLRDFNKIFIQLKRRQSVLVAGDYELVRPQSYFLNYYKKLQGGTFSNTTKILNRYQVERGTLQSKASFAVARGKFARNTLKTSEGNQGPYRLIPQEGTSVSIILSGTERVYLDGQLLARGEDADYAIDYNRGDLTFTTRRRIRQESRIIVEFEYADQSYLRTLYAGDLEWKTNRLRAHFHLYGEQDSKNATGTQSLDSLDRLALFAAGSNPDGAFTSAIKRSETGFNRERVMYALRDSLIQGRVVQVLVYSTNPDSALYTATFTPVGDGRGDYVQAASAANGRVYQYVTPDPITGVKRGAFDPIKKLTPPNAQMMLTGGLDYQITKNTNISTELAWSNRDRNLLSPLGDGQNSGTAIYSTLNHAQRWGATDSARRTQPYLLKAEAKYEYVQRTFQALNPYRAAEFTRDWNLQNALNTVTNTAILPNEQLATAKANISKDGRWEIGYELGAYLRDTFFSGQKHVLNFGARWRGWEVKSISSYLNSKGTAERTNFLRPQIEISKLFLLDKKRLTNTLKLGIIVEGERNERRDPRGSDTLTRTGAQFDWTRLYATLPQATIQYSHRNDYLPTAQQFLRLSTADEISMTAQIPVQPWGQLSGNLSYRDLQVLDTSRTNLKAQQTYLGRVEYNLTKFDNALYVNTLYEIGSGQEPKIEYQYVRVNKGEGQYVWRNRNGDTIPQLDEFELAPYADQGEYVRVTTVTNDFVRTNNVQFLQSVRLEPRSIWYERKGILHFLSNFSTNTTLQINRRVRTDDAAVQSWNPFQSDVSSTSLVALTQQLRNALAYNRGNPKWDSEIGQSIQNQRSLLSNGFEERGRTEWFLRGRVNFGRTVAFQQVLTKGTQSNTSEAFKTRDYRLDFLKWEPQLTWFVNQKFRFVGAYKFRSGINQALTVNAETLQSNDYSGEITYNQSQTTQVRTKISVVQIQFDGSTTSPAAFALLEGLQKGNNYLWNIQFERTLRQNVQLSLSYEGRQTGDVGTVHVGRAQVRASF